MLKKGAIFLIIFTIFWIFSVSANTLIERTINWHNAKIIEYKTNSKLYDIKVGIHPRDWGTLRSIMWEVGGVTWINWVFECPKDYPSCGGKNYTINERYVNWEKKWKYKSTWDRVVFGWDKNIIPFLFQTDTINKNREWEIWEGFANHPLILKNWKSQLHIYEKKWLLNYKMKARNTKNFICSNKSWDTIYFGLLYNITMQETANALSNFWCWNAINLDAGYSTTFIYNGKYILNPQRDILDWVFIVPKNTDTKKIASNAKNIIKNILSKIKPLSNSQKITQLTKLNSTLNSISQKIYKQNTKSEFAHINIYKKTLVLEDIENNPSAKKLIQTEKFKNSTNLIVENNNIYKREIESTQKKLVWTRVEINSQKTLEKIYLINLLRTYTSELSSVYKKIENLRYIKKLDLNLKINIDL